MPNKVIYEYAMIRVVPRVERGEFLNVGIILLAKNQGFLDMKYALDKSRLSVFSHEVDLENISEYLEAWKWICEGTEKGGRIGKLEVQERFRWLTATKSTIIQCSKVHPGICADPAKKLSELFEEYVL